MCFLQEVKNIVAWPYPAKGRHNATALLPQQGWGLEDISAVFQILSLTILYLSNLTASILVQVKINITSTSI